MAELAYQLPDNGRARRILRIPESHTLYLCPNSCGRRQGIRALRNGMADQVSFLRFSQTDIALGGYLAQVGDAVAELLAAVEPRPKVVALYVNCIDDFLGTDVEGLVAELSARFAGTRFVLSRISPVAADVEPSSARSIHTKLYDLLEPRGVRDAGVNLVGAFEPLPGACEFFDVLAGLGLGPVRQIFLCGTYAEYCRMADSALTVSLSHVGDEAARLMEERLGMPALRWPACYDIAETGKRYERLAACTGRCLGGAGIPGLLADARSRAERAVARARRAVGGMPLAVDSSASFMPFSLALALLDRGFAVKTVFALHVKGCDTEAEDRLAREHPEVDIVTRQSYEAVNGYGDARECVAVGADAAFLLRARHAVDMYHDEGYFGYQGIERLMDGLSAAVRTAREGGA